MKAKNSTPPQPIPLPDAYLWPMSQLEPNPSLPLKSYPLTAVREMAEQIARLQEEGGGIAASGFSEPLVAYRDGELVVLHSDNLPLFGAREAGLSGDYLVPIVITGDDAPTARLQSLRKWVYYSRQSFEMQAKAVHELLELTGMTMVELGEYLGEGKGWVQLREDVHNAHEDVKRMLRETNVAATAVQRINRVHDPQARQRFIDAILSGTPYNQISAEIAAQVARERPARYNGRTGYRMPRQRHARHTKIASLGRRAETKE